MSWIIIRQITCQKTAMFSGDKALLCRIWATHAQVQQFYSHGNESTKKKKKSIWMKFFLKIKDFNSLSWELNIIPFTFRTISCELLVPATSWSNESYIWASHSCKVVFLCAAYILSNAFWCVLLKWCVTALHEIKIH